MNENLVRMVATLSIWVTMGVIGVTAMVNGVRIGGWPAVATLVVTCVTSLIATGLVWKRPAELTEKAKRSSRVDRLLGDLSARELNELRACLSAAHDEEPVSLDELLEARRQGR